MEELTTFTQLIVWGYLLLFILLSYLVKKLLGNWLGKITNAKWKEVYTVLVIATILAVPYALVENEKWLPMLFTYTLGTSFHEILLKYLVEAAIKIFKKVFGIA